MPTFAYLLFIIVRHYLTRSSIIFDLRFSKVTLSYKYDQMKLIAFKYRFYPNNEQALILAQTFGCVRFTYNSALGFSKEQYNLGKKTNYNDWSKNLTSLKKNTDLSWLRDVSSVPLQQALTLAKRGRQGISKLSYAKGLANGTLQLMQCAPSPRAIYAEEACHQPLYLVF